MKIKFYFTVSMLLILFLVTTITFDTGYAFDKKGDSKSKKLIELCCTWGHNLKDGVLTFSIENGGKDLDKIIKLAFNDWEKALGGTIKFIYIKDISESDIEIEFIKDKRKKVGNTTTYFDENDFISFVEIFMSKTAYGVQLEKQILEHIAKHEIGHALGLGHANFKNTLMSSDIDEIITKISPCEADSVKYTNYWKFWKFIDKDVFHKYYSNDYSFECKKK